MKKILTVDDSPTMRRLVSMTATGEGYSVLESESGEAALELLQTENVDMIILDINMGGITGIETLRRIKEMPTRKNIPVMMLTTESTNAVKDKAKQYGAKGWITKPFTQSQLREVINSVLK
jgi:two-component system chemotaxis response regulator CheY